MCMLCWLLVRIVPFPFNVLNLCDLFVCLILRINARALALLTQIRQSASQGVTYQRRAACEAPLIVSTLHFLTFSSSYLFPFLTLSLLLIRANLPRVADSRAHNLILCSHFWFET